MQFPEIHGPPGPEEYSWEVTLLEGQRLRSVGSQEAEVLYEDGVVDETIQAESAHDAEGAAVPTSIGVSEPNIVTLTVHYLGGNPAANGAPFVYPIIAGPGFEVGDSTVEVLVPESEKAPETSPQGSCLVPTLKGRSLKALKRRLRKADCRLGRVKKLKGATAKTGLVVRQNPEPGLKLAPGATVRVTLGD